MVQRKKKKRKIPPHFLENKYFDELGYQEFDKLYEKFIELFNSKTYKRFHKPDLVKLTELVGNRCNLEAEAFHKLENRLIYYKKLKKVSELGLDLSKKHKGLLFNLKVACRYLDDC